MESPGPEQRENVFGPTGRTLAFAAALALGLSLAPVPDWLRPLPELGRRETLPYAVELLWPSLAGGAQLAAAPGIEPARAPETAAPAAPPPAPTDGAVMEPPPLAGAHRNVAMLASASLGALEAPSLDGLERLAAQVGARHVDIEQGCLKRKPGGPDAACERRALEPFLDALQRTVRGKRKRPVTVLHLGDSLIASDHISDLLRKRLQLRYGNGGRGLLFIDRPTRFSGRTVRTGKATEGWLIEKLTDESPPTEVLGFSGVSYTSGAEPQQSEFRVGSARFAEIFFVAEPGGGPLEVRADGKTLSRLHTRHNRPELAFARVEVPENARTLTLASLGAKVRLHGVALESGTPGVVYDSVGLPGATAGVYLQAGEKPFAAQLGRRDPSLVILMLGGNEALNLSRRRTTLEAVRGTYAELIGRIQAAAPRAACLVTSPLDAGVRTLGGDIRPRPFTAELRSLMREEALRRGCAFWDMYEAMGGEGAARRWLEAGILNEDLVHPLGRGGDLLGHLLDLALARAALESRPSGLLEDAPGLENADTALAGTFAKLRRRAAGEAQRIGMLQIGASHTAAHMFTDEVRRRLTRRFGGAGRGFVAFGKPSTRLAQAKVARTLDGDWTIRDALLAEPGGHWGLTGIRAEGGPGASASIRFCDGCPASEAPATLSLHFLEAPGMGTLQVLVDGAEVAAYPANGSAPKEPRARTVQFPVRGEAHTLEVRNASAVDAGAAGPISVFGAALELDAPGVVYDAVGLPGSTVLTFAGYDEATLSAQLAERRPDLFVFFFGTNESGLPEFDGAGLREGWARVLQRVREASPGAECLLIGPTDRMMERSAGLWVPSPVQDEVVSAMRRIAASERCAFWSARAEMGGKGSIDRWQRKGLAHRDHVHLSPKGYELLARHFVDDLLGAYHAMEDAPESGADDAAGEGR